MTPTTPSEAAIILLPLAMCAGIGITALCVNAYRDRRIRRAQRRTIAAHATTIIRRSR